MWRLLRSPYDPAILKFVEDAAKKGVIHPPSAEPNRLPVKVTLNSKYLLPDLKTRSMAACDYFGGIFSHSRIDRKRQKAFQQKISSLRDSLIHDFEKLAPGSLAAKDEINPVDSCRYAGDRDFPGCGHVFS
jgi:hypothetical protein